MGGNKVKITKRKLQNSLLLLLLKANEVSSPSVFQQSNKNPNLMIFNHLLMTCPELVVTCINFSQGLLKTSALKSYPPILKLQMQRQPATTWMSKLSKVAVSSLWSYSQMSSKNSAVSFVKATFFLTAPQFDFNSLYFSSAADSADPDDITILQQINYSYSLAFVIKEIQIRSGGRYSRESTQLKNVASLCISMLQMHGSDLQAFRPFFVNALCFIKMIILRLTKKVKPKSMITLETPYQVLQRQFKSTYAKISDIQWLAQKECIDTNDIESFVNLNDVAVNGLDSQVMPPGFAPGLSFEDEFSTLEVENVVCSFFDLPVESDKLGPLETVVEVPHQVQYSGGCLCQFDIFLNCSAHQAFEINYNQLWLIDYYSGQIRSGQRAFNAVLWINSPGIPAALLLRSAKRSYQILLFCNIDGNLGWRQLQQGMKNVMK